MNLDILVVDDDESQRHILKKLISKKLGYSVIEAENGHKCMDILKNNDTKSVQLCIIDLQMPEMNGMELLELIGQNFPSMPVIVLTGHSRVDNAIQAMKLGATDFLKKPVQADRVIVSIQNALKMSSMTQEISRLNKKESGELTFADLIGADQGLIHIVAKGRKAAASSIPVLLNGETGVGKEVFANAIHGESDRLGKPFIAVNCGALPEQLVESILFGHEKGAFTGAVAKTMGKFREANGGTIFLDEVAELPLDTQVKLLRVLQQNEVEPVGLGKSVPINVRVISATHRDLREEVAVGNFREDLYYRLNVFQIEIPSLRERTEDILPLADHFIKRFSTSENKPFVTLTEDAQTFLLNHGWPGNVRELENSLHSAIVMSDNDTLDITDFTNIIEMGIPQQSASQSASGQTSFSVPVFKANGDIKTLDEIEVDVMEIALMHFKNNVTKASKALGIAKSTFYRKFPKPDEKS